MGSPGLLGSLKTIFCKGPESPSVRTQLRSTDFKQKVVQSLDAIIPEVKARCNGSVESLAIPWCLTYRVNGQQLAKHLSPPPSQRCGPSRSSLASVSTRPPNRGLFPVCLPALHPAQLQGRGSAGWVDTTQLSGNEPCLQITAEINKQEKLS